MSKKYNFETIVPKNIEPVTKEPKLKFPNKPKKDTLVVPKQYKDKKRVKIRKDQIISDNNRRKP
eukprot:UN11056